MERLDTYTQTLEFLYAQLPMFSRTGNSALKKGLDNIRALCGYLKHPEGQYPTLHVGGTNGKGSVSHMLASVLRQAGYRCGLYTSPHLRNFRERLRIDGTMISEQEVVDLVNLLLPEIRRIQPSFFEVTVAMAFQWFADRSVDAAVIEVGLGGRLDSTNIIVPELSVITNISFDHQHILGNSLEAIAAEKAGIIKAGVPVVVGETHPQTAELFRQTALSRQAPIRFADQCWQEQEHQEYTDFQEWTLQSASEADCGSTSGRQYRLRSDLMGAYQSKNIKTALCALLWLEERGWRIPDAALEEGLSRVAVLSGLAGRWELIGRAPLTILDVAHNEAGICQVMEQFCGHFNPPYHMVVGFVRDKDIRRMLDLFPREARYYFCQARIPRALPSEELRQMAAAAGLSGTAFDEVNQALEAARNEAGPDGQVLVCGSCFVVGEVQLPDPAS